MTHGPSGTFAAIASQIGRICSKLSVAFEVYRALPANITLNAKGTTTIDVPLLLVGGEHVFGPVMPALADNLRAHHGWTDVQVDILENGRHYLPEERPDEVAELIERHATNG